MAAAPPLESLARTAAVYGGGLTLWLLASAVLRRPVSAYQQAAAVLLWLAATAVALAHAIGVLRAPAGHEVPVTAAYAAVTAALLPALWPRARSAHVPSGGLPALATGVTVVLVLRLVAVW